MTGGPVATPLDRRMIVMPTQLFTQIPFVLAGAYDSAKSPAVLAAIRGGLVDGLVTHTELARGLLTLSTSRSPG
jgi:DNA-binding transcriptional regulator LsrR (DeoR family)